MKPGTRVVSHAFSMDDWQPDQTDNVEGRTAYLWIVPAPVEGTWRWSVAGGGQKEYELVLRQQFQQVEGLVKLDSGKMGQLRNVKLERRPAQLLDPRSPPAPAALSSATTRARVTATPSRACSRSTTAPRRSGRQLAVIEPALFAKTARFSAPFSFRRSLIIHRDIPVWRSA